MWEVKELKKGKGHLKFEMEEKGNAVSYSRFLELLVEEPEFVQWYNQWLAECPFDAFFWEHKPMTVNNLDKPCECNLVESEVLSRVSPDVQTFHSHFQANKNAVSFANLGGDAQLIAPCPVSDPATYPQIGDFVRRAPKDQILDFWQLVGTETQKQLTNKPRWLSTSGLGVYWLHVRIDTVPKYYQTEEYKSSEF